MNNIEANIGDGGEGCCGCGGCFESVRDIQEGWTDIKHEGWGGDIRREAWGGLKGDGGTQV